LHKATLEKEFKTIKDKYEGAGTQDLAEISERLYKLDPSEFRKTMQALNYTGDEPNWVKGDMKDDVKGAQAENNPESLKNEIHRLKLEKRDIAAEFDKMKHMLQLQHDLESDNLRLYKEEGK